MVRAPFTGFNVVLHQRAHLWDLRRVRQIANGTVNFSGAVSLSSSFLFFSLFFRAVYSSGAVFSFLFSFSFLVAHSARVASRVEQ